MLKVSLHEFNSGKDGLQKISDIVGKEALLRADAPISKEDGLEFIKAPLKEINEAFSWCHQYIYKNDNISQGAAFMEFVKIVALKLLSDRYIRDNYPQEVEKDVFLIPHKDVKFSSHLLNEQGRHTPNPLSSIWFSEFIKEMEREIIQKKKKRIFSENDAINLSPETVSGVVDRLQKLFLFGIDADLNGRLFETFLSATMRGKDLGQYFTPRSLVKLGVGLARLRVDPLHPERSDRVYDGCCGTGGFLIDVLADMWSKVNSNNSLSAQKKEQLRQRIANHHIFGSDIGRDPNLSRIARLNMYLHGDGGSCIFNVDALDKDLPDTKSDNPELADEKAQMRTLAATPGGAFDVVITNPPFAKAYSLDGEKKDQPTNAARILKQYQLLYSESGGKVRKELRSNLMFIERYRDLLREGGRLVTVLDDGILSAKDYQWFRDWIRQEFLVNAVISLPGDAFQRSAARVKTSILVLTKRSGDEVQPNVFMYPCEIVGLDDPARARTLPIDAENRKKAKSEISTVLKKYEEFLMGDASEFSVAADRISDRLDVKHCLMTRGQNIPGWQKSGFSIFTLSEIIAPADYSTSDVIECSTHDEIETPLVVRYDGSAISGTEITPSETGHNKLHRVKAGQIVVSNIAASYGSIAVVPEELAGNVVSSEYTILQVKKGFDPSVVWAILRSPVVLSEILLVATGANRTRVKWEAMSTIKIPYPNDNYVHQFSLALHKAKEEERIAREKINQQINGLVDLYGLQTKDSETILSAFKPPK